MKESLTKRETDVFLALLRNSKISDRDLAKKFNTSQPTVTRIRNKLFEKNFIENYSINPGLKRIGLNLIALTFLRSADFKSRKSMEKWIKSNPDVFFSAKGEGLREFTDVVFTLHPDFRSYELFLDRFRKSFGSKVVGVSSFLISNRSFVKPFSYVDAIEKHIANKGIKKLVEKIPFVKRKLRDSFEEDHVF